MITKSPKKKVNQSFHQRVIIDLWVVPGQIRHLLLLGYSLMLRTPSIMPDFVPVHQGILDVPAGLCMCLMFYSSNYKIKTHHGEWEPLIMTTVGVQTWEIKVRDLTNRAP